MSVVFSWNSFFCVAIPVYKFVPIKRDYRQKQFLCFRRMNRSNDSAAVPQHGTGIIRMFARSPVFFFCAPPHLS